MTSKDNAQDEELLSRYRQASETDGAAPSETVRTAILAESRRAAEQLAKKALQHPFDVSRPAANESRWKITAFGTAGAALLAALLIAPRFWENRPTTQASNAPAAKSASSDAAAPPPATVPQPKLESLAPASPRESLQEAVVAQENRKASKRSVEESRQYAAPAPSNSPSVAQNYARAPASRPPVATSLAPLPAPAAPAASVAPPEMSARAQGGALSMSADRMATPASLQSAAGLGDVTQAALLLDQGVAVDARDEAGRTPLMLAVAQGRLEIVRLLLARGADPNAADNAGRTPLQQARERNLRDVAALLQRGGAH